MWRPVVIAGLIVGGLLVYAYSDQLGAYYMRLSDRMAPKPPSIAVVYPPGVPDDGFLKGVELAVDGVNAEGGVLGRPLDLRRIPEPAPQKNADPTEVVVQSLAIARQIAADPRVIAAIGHSTSRSAITASAVYAHAGKLYLAPYATNVSLVRHRLDTVFAMLPNNRVLAYVLARYASEQGYRQMVLISDESEYGRDTALFFAVFAEGFGIEIVYRDAFRPARKSIEDILTLMVDNTTFAMNKVDAMLAIAEPAETGKFIELARRLNIRVPILGTDAISDPGVARVAGPAMRDVVGVTVFNPATSQAEGRAFVEAFEERYRTAPSLWATLGYDAVRLVAEAVRRTRSLEGSVLADLLRIMRFENPIVAASGAYGFTRRGEVIGRSVFIVRHDGETFRFAKRYDSLPRFGDSDDAPPPLPHSMPALPTAPTGGM